MVSTGSGRDGSSCGRRDGNRIGGGIAVSGTYEKTSRLLETEFLNRWKDIGTGLPVAWENIPFTQPKSGKWLRFSIRFGEGRLASLGRSPAARVTGVVFFQIFYPKGKGTRGIRATADRAAETLSYRYLEEGRDFVIYLS